MNLPGVIALAGPQGSGKSTFASRIQSEDAPETLVLALDDFYLPKIERQKLADRVSPLFATRGPPGTHDVSLLDEILDALTTDPFVPVEIPRFDKLADDRIDQCDWRTVSEKPKTIILEGWCVGAKLAPGFVSGNPMNEIERADTDGRWRQFQADKLKTSYAALWARIDQFIYLTAPDFETVKQWRLEQEAATRGVTVNELEPDVCAWVERFVDHYERLTRNMGEGFCCPGEVWRLDKNRNVMKVDRF